MSSAPTAIDTPAPEGQPDDASSASPSVVISQVVSFRLANEEYGLDIMHVQEIILVSEITQIPEVASYIRGLINLRGQVIPIVDLRKRFSLEVTDTNEHTRIIVVNSQKNTFGIVVDGVSEVLRIDAEQIEPPPPGLVGLEQNYINGLVKQEDKIMILLDVKNILSSEDQEVMKQCDTAETPAF